MIFKGVCTALITPFDQHDGVNYKAFAAQLDYQLSSGVDAVVVLGTTGEPSTMTAAEKAETVKFAVNYINKRVPVIVGVGTNSTAATIENAKMARENGADALLAVTPYYNKCTNGGLAAHYKALADSTDLPIIVYNVPGRTGVNITPDAYKLFCDHKNIVATKEACGNMEQISHTAAVINGKMDLYSGDDAVTLPVMAIGGLGVISVASNVVPALMKKLTDSFFAGDIASARDMQLKLLPLIKALFKEVNPIPVKAAVDMIGLNGGKPRLPLTEAEETTKEMLRKELSALGIL